MNIVAVIKKIKIQKNLLRKKGFFFLILYGFLSFSIPFYSSYGLKNICQIIFFRKRKVLSFKIIICFSSKTHFKNSWSDPWMRRMLFWRNIAPKIIELASPFLCFFNCFPLQKISNRNLAIFRRRCCMMIKYNIRPKKNKRTSNDRSGNKVYAFAVY